MLVERLWGPLGASLTALGASWGPLRVSLTALGASWGALGRVLEALRELLGTPSA